MRIAMLSYHTCPLATLGGKDTGGMNVYVRDLTRELGRRGLRVDVFTRSQDEHQPHVKEELGYGNRVIHIPAGPEVPLPREILYQHVPEFVGGVREFARANDLHYDVIHAHYWLSGVAARSLRETWHIPFVLMFHTLGHMKNRVAQSEAEREGALRVQVETELMAQADRLIAATPAEIAQMQWLYGADVSRAVIIPPGVDLNLFYPRPANVAKQRIGVDPDRILLLFVGRIEPLKGLETLLRALAVLKERGVCQCNQLALSIIGGDPEEDAAQRNAEMERIKALRSRLGLEGMVTFLGKQDQDTLPDYYSAADAVVMPSHYESFGMVALEAMACGTPVIASEVGGLAFLVKDGETGFHVPDRDPEALADRICDIITDPLLRAKLGGQAAEYARSYCWPLIADKIIAVYRELHTGRAPAWLERRGKAHDGAALTSETASASPDPTPRPAGNGAAVY
ncbi:MAG: glycosyltransferase [Anaerolineales bacterium]|nr:glycosyltransferase [Anaerolineales bacterium]